MQKVFFSDIKGISDVLNVNIESEQRRKYIDSISDGKRRKESVLVWKLLEYALSGYYHIEKATFIKEECGKWASDIKGVDFSLSHSNNIVVAAISDRGAVGADTERISDKIFKVEKYIFQDLSENPTEKDNLKKALGADKAEKLTFLWTRKESRIKSGIICPVYTDCLIFDGEGNKYCLSIAASLGGFELIKVNAEDIL